jgi:hypothetical protein
MPWSPMSARQARGCIRNEVIAGARRPLPRKAGASLPTVASSDRWNHAAATDAPLASAAACRSNPRCRSPLAHPLPDQVTMPSQHRNRWHQAGRGALDSDRNSSKDWLGRRARRAFAKVEVGPDLLSAIHRCCCSGRARFNSERGSGRAVYTGRRGPPRGWPEHCVRATSGPHRGPLHRTGNRA